jgi:hypothetical protein
MEENRHLNARFPSIIWFGTLKNTYFAGLLEVPVESSRLYGAVKFEKNPE